MIAVVEIPIFIPSRANFRGHTRSKKHRKTVQEQRNVTRLALQAHVKDRPALPCAVTLTRIAPRFLDWGDNLPMSMKSVRDGVADWFGIDDADRRLVWRYNQQKPEKPRGFGLVIKIEPLSPEDCA